MHLLDQLAKRVYCPRSTCASLPRTLPSTRSTHVAYLCWPRMDDSRTAACIISLPSHCVISSTTPWLHRILGFYSTRVRLKQQDGYLRSGHGQASDAASHMQCDLFIIDYCLRVLFFFSVTAQSCMSGLTSCMGRREWAFMVRRLNYRGADYKLSHCLRTVVSAHVFSGDCFCAVVSVFIHYGICPLAPIIIFMQQAPFVFRENNRAEGNCSPPSSSRSRQLASSKPA